MVVKTTIRKKNEKGRWNFLVNAALRQTPGCAVVVEGLDKKSIHSAAESIRQRATSDVIAIEWRSLLVVYKPSEDWWHEQDEKEVPEKSNHNLQRGSFRI